LWLLTTTNFMHSMIDRFKYALTWFHEKKNCYTIQEQHLHIFTNLYTNRHHYVYNINKIRKYNHFKWIFQFQSMSEWIPFYWLGCQKSLKSQMICRMYYRYITNRYNRYITNSTMKTLYKTSSYLLRNIYFPLQWLQLLTIQSHITEFYNIYPWISLINPVKDNIHATYILLFSI
jgi:hypothetical protein